MGRPSQNMKRKQNYREKYPEQRREHLKIPTVRKQKRKQKN